MSEIDENTTVCPRSDLGLIRPKDVDGFHVGSRRHALISARPRDWSAGGRSTWGRFDTDGETFYIAEDELCALAEVLAPFKTRVGRRSVMKADAKAAGFSSVEAYLEAVSEDLGEQGFHGAGVVPATWRDNRRIITIHVREPGWLVRLDHSKTYSSLEQHHGDELDALGVDEVTTGVLTGEDRTTTTAIANILRTTVLFDLESPVGVHFESKHKTGWCQAYWMSTVPRHALTAASENSIPRDHPALVELGKRWGLTFL